MYGRIGGKSPLNDITVAQARALEEALNSSFITDHSSLSLRVYVGMRYWHPYIEDAVEQMRRDSISHVLAITLYPHYSLATTGSALGRFEEVIKDYPMQFSSIPSWYNHPIYIDALIDLIRKAMVSFAASRVPGESGNGGPVQVLFSAHGLPAKIVESGDPYVSHIKATIKEVAEKMNIKWDLAYQSRSGPVRWIGPSTGDKIRELAAAGARNILIVPVSFVSDHVETLYEIDILFKEEARRLGVNLIRTESLNLHPLFIKALEDMTTSKMKELGWTG